MLVVSQRHMSELHKVVSFKTEEFFFVFTLTIKLLGSLMLRYNKQETCSLMAHLRLIYTYVRFCMRPDGLLKKQNSSQN
jgi:hypothetical protein